MSDPSNTSHTPNDTPATKTPEKYIRTFAGDMDTLKKTEASPHVPLGTVSSIPKKVTEQSPPLPQVTTPEPVPTRIKTSTEEPSPLPTPEAPKSSPLQTYTNDFSERMKTTHASTATVLAAEQDSAPRTSPVAPEEYSRANLPYIIAGTVLVIVGVVGGLAIYLHYRNVSAPVVSVPIAKAPIFFDEREEVSGTDITLLQAVVDSVNRPLAAGTVRLLSATTHTASASSSLLTTSNPVFVSIPALAPEILLRNIRAADSMVGVINVSGKQSSFLILSISSYSTVFSSMLSWEPLMPGHFSALFPPLTSPIVDASTTPSVNVLATTTTAVVSDIFTDEVIASHDVRVYRDTLGRDILIYGFWNQETLVIARDTAAFVEIVGRLATAPPS